jgi:uncharacterized Tic20 family protein
MSVPPESMIPPPPSEPPMAGGPSAEERQWAMFAHLAALSGLIIPFGSIIGPLVIWLIKKDTVAIAAIVCWLLMLVLIGFLLLPALVILWLVFVIIGTIKANEGSAYRYPFTLRLVS